MVHEEQHGEVTHVRAGCRVAEQHAYGIQLIKRVCAGRQARLGVMASSRPSAFLCHDVVRGAKERLELWVLAQALILCHTFDQPRGTRCAVLQSDLQSSKAAQQPGTSMGVQS